MTGPNVGKIVLFDMNISFSGRGHHRKSTYVVVTATKTNAASCPVKLWVIVGRVLRNFVHLSDIEYHRYFYIHELLYGLIEDLNLALRTDNTVKGSVVRFVKQDMIAYPTFIPHQNVLLSNILELFYVNAAPLQRFLIASYDDQVYEDPAWYLEVHPLNASQIHCTCPVLLRRKMFGHYTPLRRFMTDLNGLAVMGETQTIISLIDGT